MTLYLCASEDQSTCFPVGQRVAYHDTIEDCRNEIRLDLEEWALTVPSDLFVGASCEPHTPNTEDTI